MRKIEHKFDSRPHCCIEQAEHPAAGTARGACTGNALNIAAIVLHDRVCEIRKSLIEEFDLRCVRAFLRSEHMRSTFWSGQRIGDIAGENNRNIFYKIGNFRIVNPLQINKRTATKRNIMTCRIKKTKSKRASQPRATIRSGTTAQTKHNTIRASVNRSTNQQSGAERGSRQRIAVGGGDPFKSACRSQLDHGGVKNTRSTIIAKKAKLSGNRAADRINCLNIVQRAGGGMNQGLCQSFAAIGKRHEPAFRLRIATLNAASHRLCDCFSRSGLLERVRCQQNPHICLLLRLHPYINAVPGQRLIGSPPTWAGGTGRLRIPPTWRSGPGRACAANAAARRPSWRIPH